MFNNGLTRILYRQSLYCSWYRCMMRRLMIVSLERFILLVVLFHAHLAAGRLEGAFDDCRVVFVEVVEASAVGLLLLLGVVEATMPYDGASSLVDHNILRVSYC